MVRTFVAINDAVHDLLRNITRYLPLAAGFGPDERWSVQYQLEGEELPEPFYVLAGFHALQGLPLGQVRLGRWRVRPADKLAILQRVGGLDVVKLDRRCARDLRLRIGRQGAGMLAAELLAFGSGTLRACNDDPQSRIHFYLGSRYGRIHSRLEVVHGRILALRSDALTDPLASRKEFFDSTNVIYGDAYGELEQLWDRRADTVFLEQIARHLRRLRTESEVAGFVQPPRHLPLVMKAHLRCQAIWKTPPHSARALLRRVEFILDRTTLDAHPQTVLRWRQPAPQNESGPAPGGRAAWDADRSGYDGWLPGSD